MPHAVGIDLGTTYSAVAVSPDGRTARVLPTQEGSTTTPSVVFFPDLPERGHDEPLVGVMAKNSYAQAPYNTISLVKREMGNPAYKYASPNGNTYTAEELSGIILRHIKQYAQIALGEDVTDAVITVPAYFDDARRTATKQAGVIAGFNVLGLLNEPTAAAIAYGLTAEGRGRVLVYDLGGGTFDITLMDITSPDMSSVAQLRAIATDGDPYLGGADWDHALRDLMVEQLVGMGATVDEEDDALQNELLEKAEILKKGLSAVEQSTAIFTIAGQTYRIRVTRAQFEEATKVLVARTRERLEVMMQSQGVPWSSIDNFLLVGGSTKMPMIRTMAEQLWGKPIPQQIDPDTAVAIGAAIYARYLSGGDTGNEDVTAPLAIQDITSQSLGVIANNDTGRPANSIIIPRNTPIPVKRSELYSTVVDNQTSINVQVTEGNDEDLDYVALIGERELPIPPYPKDSPVLVTFAYDIDQTVFIEVTDGVTNQSLGTFTINRQANMTDDQMALARARVQNMEVDGMTARTPGDTANYWKFIGIAPTTDADEIRTAIGRTRALWAEQASRPGAAGIEAQQNLLYLNEITQALLG